MTTAEISARLVLVNNAINDILTKKVNDVTIDGQGYTVLDLDLLDKMRTKLERELTVSTVGVARPCVVRFQGAV